MARAEAELGGFICSGFGDALGFWGLGLLGFGLWAFWF